MNEFVNWATLGTYGGALSMVMLLTQFTKEWPFTKKMPTQLWSYILALLILLCATAFTSGLTIDIFFQTLFNAVIISIAANGGFTALNRVAGVLSGDDT